MKKFIYHRFLFIASLLTIVAIVSSCNEDETLERKGKPTVSVLNSGISVQENAQPDIEFSLSYSIKNTTHMRVEIIGGTAIEGEDYTVNLETIESAGGGYFGGEGYFATIPPFTTDYVLSDFITINQDNITEGRETIELQLFSASKGYAIVDQTYTINIDDYTFCNWTLVTNDAYGDGWNGGFITVTSGGISTDYAPTNFTATFEIPIEEGEDYQITYTSGGGTGQAPGWEEENTYTLTAPDGTSWSDGPIPMEGIIINGINNCP